MLSDAHCANHPTRAAEIACARCGTFVCKGCVVSGDLCSECKTRLLREARPWTAEEKARVIARRCLRWSQRTLTAVMVLSVLAVTLHLGAAEGTLPAALATVAQLLLGLAAALGLCLAGLAGRGYQTSEGGRPGPAVPGVFPGTTAAFLATVGLAPAIAALALIP